MNRWKRKTSSTNFCWIGIRATNLNIEVSLFNLLPFITGRLRHGRGRKWNHNFSNMTATISNKMQWRFKSSMDLLCIYKKPLFWPRDLLTWKEMNELTSMGRAAATANCETSLASWQCGWEVSEHFGVCAYKLSLAQDGVCWKWALIRSFNMKTWWWTLINHLLDFMGWALSSPERSFQKKLDFVA